MDGRTINDPSGYSDQVEGFTNGQYFHALMPTTINMPILRSFYLSSYLSGTSNTPQQVNDLFDQYNF